MSLNVKLHCEHTGRFVPTQRGGEQTPSPLCQTASDETLKPEGTQGATEQLFCAIASDV